MWSGACRAAVGGWAGACDCRRSPAAGVNTSWCMGNARIACVSHPGSRGFIRAAAISSRSPELQPQLFHALFQRPKCTPLRVSAPRWCGRPFAPSPRAGIVSLSEHPSCSGPPHGRGPVRRTLLHACETQEETSRPGPCVQEVTLLTVTGQKARVYATDVKLQGDGVGSRAVSMDEPSASILLDGMTPVQVTCCRGSAVTTACQMPCTSSAGGCNRDQRPLRVSCDPRRGLARAGPEAGDTLQSACHHVSPRVIM